MVASKELRNFDTLELAHLIRTKELSADELLESVLARSDEVNPSLNAIIYRDDEAARTAIAAGLPEGPFAGVPYLLKDLYAFFQGMPTGNGSRSYAGFVPDHDSTLCTRLRAAGFVIFGKTNTPELGLNATTEPAVNGATHNPWNLERSAGGSSGGSAAVVAARVLPSAHATDGGGSIRIPASNCGLFGLKPTRARIPLGPDVGEGWSGLSTVHAVTRSVRDSAAILDVTAGPAPGDPYCAPPPTGPFLDEVGRDPGRLKIALWVEGLAGERVAAECVRGAQQTAHLCEDLGHSIEVCAPPVSIRALRDAMRVIVAANVTNAMNLRGDFRGAAVTQHDLETVTWQLLQEGKHVTGSAYAHALLTIHTLGRQLGEFFSKFDVLLSPTLADPPLPLGTLDMMSGELDIYWKRLMDSIPFTPLYNATGCPAASVPLHWSDEGTPIGVQIGAGFGNEALLLRLASQLERAQPWHQHVPDLVA